MTHLRRIAIVGAGLAGLRSAETLRSCGYDGAITLIGDETAPPYNRPPLSKQFLTTDLPPEDLTLPTRAGLQLDLRLGVCATALRPHERALETDHGSIGDLDAVFIATGARARAVTMSSLEGIRTLRNVSDAEQLRDDLRRGGPVVVLGAGFIGCEIAASCVTLGLPVTVVDLAEAPMLRVLGREAGERMAALHQNAGVTLRFGVGLAAVEGRRRIESIRLTDGTRVLADTLVVAIGSHVDTRWLDGVGLDLRDGVTCDEHGRAAGADGHVLAVGDISRWAGDHPALSGERGEHWTGAAEQATIAVRALLGQPTPALTAPFVWSDQHGHRLQVIGRPTNADTIAVAVEPAATPANAVATSSTTTATGHDAAMTGRSTGDDGSAPWALRYLREGKLVGCIAFDQPGIFARARRELAATRSVPTPAGTHA